MLRLLHVSDLHFGVDNIPEQVDAIEALIRSAAYDVLAVSGDLTQRARRGEFGRAREFLERAAAVCTVLAVPGNHDVTWWRAPMRVGVPSWMYAKWRRYLGRGIEPVVRIGGTTIAGVNTAHGVAPYTLTKRPRDLSVIGALRAVQIERLSREFSQHPADRRVVVMHHNPIRGEISERYGFKDPAGVMDRLANLGVTLVLCGHDHQEAVRCERHNGVDVVVSVAGTITTRSRGQRPQSVNEIDLEPDTIVVRTRTWDAARMQFSPGPEQRFPDRLQATRTTLQ